MSIPAYISPDSVRVLFEKGTYFGNDSIFALPGNPIPGAEGEILPYALSHDYIVTCILALCFILLCYVLSKGSVLIIHQLKEFFSERERNNMFVETGSEFRYQAFLIFHACIMLSILVYDLQLQHVFPQYIHPSWEIIGYGILTAVIYYCIKFFLYELVNWVFFEKQKADRWNEINFLVISLQGLLFFPLACLSIYSLPNSQFIFFPVLFVIVLAKILLFYKSFSIFFNNFRGLCYNILYFCTLETIPLLILWKVVREIC